jgi:hypothetical protein
MIKEFVEGPFNDTGSVKRFNGAMISSVPHRCARLIFSAARCVVLSPGPQDQKASLAAHALEHRSNKLASAA